MDPRAVVLIAAVLWVLALALRYGPARPPAPPPTTVTCELVDPLWLPVCRD
jgi:hypothetical protein